MQPHIQPIFVPDDEDDADGDPCFKFNNNRKFGVSLCVMFPFVRPWSARD